VSTYRKYVFKCTAGGMPYSDMLIMHNGLAYVTERSGNALWRTVV